MVSNYIFFKSNNADYKCLKLEFIFNVLKNENEYFQLFQYLTPNVQPKVEFLKI